MARVKPLRDFFATLFFVSLGMQLNIPHLTKLIMPFLIFFLIIIFIKPLMIMLTTAAFGYKKRTTFITGTSLGQISEFSMILAAQGAMLGHISQEIFSLTIVLAIVTIALTNYIVKYQQKIYGYIASDLSIFEYANPLELEYKPKQQRVEYLLCGCNRLGYSILHKLLYLKKKFLVIDYDPKLIRDLIAKRVPCLYADVGNPEVLDHFNLKSLKFVISTITNPTVSLLLVDAVKKINRHIPLFVTAATIDEALELYKHGADYVILPHFLGGDHVSLLLEKIVENPARILQTKVRHVEELSSRRKLGQAYG